MAAALERELDALYQLPLDQFTSARDELAKRLRTDGQAEQAEQVKALRKPTVAVWLVNRLVREDELDVQRLLKAGESLAKTQTKLAQGQSPEAFLDARREEQRALERLARAAQRLAEREGVGRTAMDRATQTLRAASLTDEGRRLLKQGRLTEGSAATRIRSARRNELRAAEATLRASFGADRDSGRPPPGAEGGARVAPPPTLRRARPPNRCARRSPRGQAH
jgi:hypothetical protein